MHVVPLFKIQVFRKLKNKTKQNKTKQNKTKNLYMEEADIGLFCEHLNI